MWNALQSLSFRDWLILGTFLLILEIFGAGGYLLWIGLAALGVGTTVFLLPDLSWLVQLPLFAVLCIATVVLWWNRQRRVQAATPSLLNDRGQKLIGQVFLVQEALVGGRGKLKVGDGVWLAQGPDMPAGSRARVVTQQDVVLHVVPADTSAPVELDPDKPIQE
jgi:membrane protein implicated in regulation of membrane protease activity